MSRSPTTTVGPLGSTIHSLHADRDTIAALASVDWSRHFRRVCLDPVRGLVTLMAPSRLHDDLAGIFVDIVDIATGAFGRPSKGLLTTRLRGRGDPPGTGMEPDCAFYVRKWGQSGFSVSHPTRSTTPQPHRKTHSDPIFAPTGREDEVRT